MEHPALRGRSILVVENELLIAMDIAQALESAGANATMTTTVRHALILIEHDGLAGAIMDHALTDGDSTKLCARLKERGIPYLSYSGYEPVEGASTDAPHIMQACEHGRVDERDGRIAGGTCPSFLRACPTCGCSFAVKERRYWTPEITTIGRSKDGRQLAASAEG